MKMTLRHFAYLAMMVVMACITTTQANAQGNDLIGAAANGDLSRVRALLEAKADVNAKTNDGATALYVASQEGHADVARVLLEAKADVNSRMNDGSTALCIASQNGHTGVVQLLLSNGADVNARDNNAMTALLLASQQGQFEVVKALLGKGADVNLKNAEGATALMRAAFNRHRAVVQALLAKDADVNAKTNNGRTALMLACFGGDPEIVRALISKGADVNARTSNGRTASDAAAAGGHPELKALLVQASPAPKAGAGAKGNDKPSPAKPAHAGTAPASVKEVQSKIVGTWARMYDGAVPRDEKGSLTGSILSFDANNQITFEVVTNSASRMVDTGGAKPYRIEKDSDSGLFVLSGAIYKFAIVSIGADTLSIRYFDDHGKPADWVAKWQRMSKEPILPH